MNREMSTETIRNKAKELEITELFEEYEIFINKCMNQKKYPIWNLITDSISTESGSHVLGFVHSNRDHLKDRIQSLKDDVAVFEQNIRLERLKHL